MGGASGIFREQSRSHHTKTSRPMPVGASQGEISLCLFDSVLGGKNTSWDKIMWNGKDYEEAITFAEVSVIRRSEGNYRQ